MKVICERDFNQFAPTAPNSEHISDTMHLK